MLDDGSLALVSRPAPPARPSAFAKRLSVPADADLRRESTQPLGEDGGLVVTVPRLRRQPARQQVPMPPRPVPIPVRRAAASDAPKQQERAMPTGATERNTKEQQQRAS